MTDSCGVEEDAPTSCEMDNRRGLSSVERGRFEASEVADIKRSSMVLLFIFANPSSGTLEMGAEAGDGDTFGAACTVEMSMLGACFRIDS